MRVVTLALWTLSAFSILSACGTTLICTIHIYIATTSTLITHELRLSGFVAQSVQQRTIKSIGRGFDSRQGQIFFFFASCGLLFFYQG